VLNAYDAFSAYVAASNRAEWVGHNPSAARLVGWIEKERFKKDTREENS
jgi:hypothetical protein